MKCQTGNQIYMLQVQFGHLQFNENYDNIHGAESHYSAQFNILDYPRMEISEDEFTSNDSTGPVDFSKGKSIMITLKSKEMKNLQNKFKINIQIMRTSTQGGLMPQIEQVAQTSIDIANIFNLFLSACNGGPTVKVIKDLLELIDVDSGDVIGTICIFLQLKSFGSYIMSPMENISKTIESNKKSCKKLNQNKSKQNGDGDDEFSEIEHQNQSRIQKMRVYKSNQSMAKAKLDAFNLQPGSVLVENDQVLFKMKNKNKKSASKPKTIYDMKTTEPSGGQMIEIIPKLNIIEGEKVGPLTGKGPNGNTDVYFIRIGKTNYKKNLNTKLDMEVRVPREVNQKKERLNQNVQYLETDVVTAAKKKK